MMKKLTLDEFKALVMNDEWVRQHDHEIIDRIVRERDEQADNDDFLSTTYYHTFGWASVTSTLDGIVITYTEGFDYDDYQPETFSASTEGQSDVWKIEGCVVVDEDGDPIDADDLKDYLTDAFSATDYSNLQIDEVDDIDLDEGIDMETFTLLNDNEPNVRFTGELVARTASSCDNAAGSNQSGQTGRWTELLLYKTVGGKYICQQIGHTQWQNERTRYKTEVCDSIEQVIAFFGHRWLAKDLYAEAGIEDVVTVE